MNTHEDRAGYAVAAISQSAQHGSPVTEPRHQLGAFEDLGL